LAKAIMSEKCGGGRQTPGENFDVFASEDIGLVHPFEDVGEEGRLVLGKG
jgi:hypothetical protein